MINKDIEIGKIFINSEKSHFSAGRAPVGHEQSSNSSIAERGNETVAGGEIGNRGSMQRERRAEQGGDVALGHRKVTQPDCPHLERNLSLPCSFPRLRCSTAVSIARQSCQQRRPGLRI